jgi:Rieske Fe-S protein
MQCNVHWEPRLSFFVCPCHGGLYTITGANAGGPPPLPLSQWVHRITTDSTGRRILQIANRLEESI